VVGPRAQTPTIGQEGKKRKWLTWTRSEPVLEVFNVPGPNETVWPAAYVAQWL